MKTTLIAGAVSVVSIFAAEAHHSIARVYDSGRRVTVAGIVEEFQLVNPHPLLMMAVEGDGRVQQWRLEMDNRRELVEIGVTANTFRPGDRLVVSGSLARTQPQNLYVLRLDRPADGFWYEQIGQTPRIRKE
jgi:hypothetical protein